MSIAAVGSNFQESSLAQQLQRRLQRRSHYVFTVYEGSQPRYVSTHWNRNCIDQWRFYFGAGGAVAPQISD